MTIAGLQIGSEIANNGPSASQNFANSVTTLRTVDDAVRELNRCPPPYLSQKHIRNMFTVCTHLSSFLICGFRRGTISIVRSSEKTMREVEVSASSASLQIGDGIRAHIRENVGTILVGTRDATLTPEITRGWGPTILPDGHTIDVCISLSAGAKTLKNLGACDEIAVTFHQTVTYRTVQLKGRFLESGELTPEDWEAVERQKKILTEQAKMHGIPLSIGLRVLSTDLVRIRFVVQQAFERTPGPRAGSSL